MSQPKFLSDWNLTAYAIAFVMGMVYYLIVQLLTEIVP